jgi:hypothetical protein
MSGEQISLFGFDQPSEQPLDQIDQRVTKTKSTLKATNPSILAKVYANLA